MKRKHDIESHINRRIGATIFDNNPGEDRTFGKRKKNYLSGFRRLFK